MNKKGFTLVELLVVIAILGLLIAIISPVVKNLLNDSKDSLSEQQKKLVVEATKKYMIEHSELLPEGSNRAIVYMSDLIDKGVIDNDKIIDPKSKEEINGCVVVSYNNEFNQYDYNYSENGNDCSIFTFDYVGHEYVFNVRKDGYYKLETWGAQGGNHGNDEGGFGGYSTGIVNLKKSNIIYINVGGKGSQNCDDTTDGFCYGGYNGGGYSYYLNNQKCGAGGGATHIALKSGLLNSLENDIDTILVVSGGGGGIYSNSYKVGSAGGYIGNNGYLREGYVQSIGGSQISGGLGYESGSFGLGGNYTQTINGTGGGAGFYGAGSARASSAGGGSSYIGNPLLINKSMFCYDCQESNETSTFTVSTTGTSTLKDTTNCPNGYSENPIAKCAKAGNGYAKIKYLGESIN